jgi:flagellar basal-body rod protein FlgC
MFGNGFSAIDVSASGLAAERYRMEIIASNIANAHTTRTDEGGPYRRQQVVFAAHNESFQSLLGTSPDLQGVTVAGIMRDTSELPRVHNPGHPDADADGMVTMPNVRIPLEMVDLISATRSYEANLRSIQTFRQMARQTLALLRGGV